MASEAADQNEELKKELKTNFALPEAGLTDTLKTFVHGVLNEAKETGTLQFAIWAPVKDSIERHHKEQEGAKLAKARSSVERLPIENQISILRYALGQPRPVLDVHTSGQSISSLDSASASARDKKRPAEGSAASVSSGSRKQSKISPTEFTIDTETQNLLLEVLKKLPEDKIEELKEKIGRIPWEENSAGSSYGPNSFKYVDFLGDFTHMLMREDGLSADMGKAAKEAFLEKFSHEKEDFFLLRETLLNDSVRADIAGANDGQTVAADELGE